MPLLPYRDAQHLVSVQSALLATTSLVCFPQNHLLLNMPAFSIRKEVTTYVTFLLESKCRLESEQFGLNRLYQRHGSRKESCGGHPPTPPHKKTLSVKMSVLTLDVVPPSTARSTSLPLCLHASYRRDSEGGLQPSKLTKEPVRRLRQGLNRLARLRLPKWPRASLSVNILSN